MFWLKKKTQVTGYGIFEYVYSNNCESLKYLFCFFVTNLNKICNVIFLRNYIFLYL